MNFRGTRIARIQVFVNGRLRSSLTLGALQKRIGTRVRLAPGRYRVRIRVIFQLGSGTRPLTFRRVVRVCGLLARHPRFTG
jgi:hypothetical protein